MTIEDTLEESNRAIENYFKRKKAETEEMNRVVEKYFEGNNAKTMAKSPYPQGVAAGSSGTGNANKFEHQLEGQEGQGIGDIYANQQLAQLNVTAEQGQAKVVGEEATIAETRRLLLEEQKSLLVPSKLGPDMNGNYVVRDHSERHSIVVNGERLHQLIAYYREPLIKSREQKYNVKIDRDSLIDNIYEHARRLGVYFGDGFKRNFLNPEVYGRHLSIKVYGTYRWNFLKGALFGTEVELCTSFLPADELKGILAALEPESVSARAKEQEEG